jgi:hypothetical protein
VRCNLHLPLLLRILIHFALPMNVGTIYDSSFVKKRMLG